MTWEEFGFLAASGGGIDLDVITANPADVRAGKVIVDKDGEPLTGTLPDRGSWGVAELVAGETVIIPAGIHDGMGMVTAKSLADQTPGNLAAAKMLSGVYGYSNGVKVTGNIASMAAQTVTPGNAAKTVSCSGKYMTGNVTVQAVANLTAANIKKGVTVGGVTGTWEGYVAAATDLYYKGANPAGFKSNGDDAMVSYSFDGTYITLTSTTTAANAGSITASKAYNFSGYSNLIVEFNVATATTSYTVADFDLMDSAGNKLIHKTCGDFVSTGSKSFTFSLANLQKTFTPRLRICPRKAKIQITRIRIA